VELLRGVSAACSPPASVAAICAEAEAGRPPPALCEAIDAFLYDSAARVPGRVDAFLLRSPGDRARNVIVRVLAEHGGPVRKADVTAAFRAATGPDAEVSQAAYTRYMHEIGLSGTGGTWTFKTGNEAV
jgi:hypothetical protein